MSQGMTTLPKSEQTCLPNDALRWPWRDVLGVCNAEPHRCQRIDAAGASCAADLDLFHTHGE